MMHQRKRMEQNMMEDWPKLAANLERLLRLKSIPFGMKLFERSEEMEAIPKIRRPNAVHTLDQIVAQAARLGWTVGITSQDLVGAQCRAVVGLGLAKDDAWRSGQHMVGFGTALLKMRGRIRSRCIACRTAVMRRSPYRRWRAAGSTRPTSHCSMRHPER